MTDQQSAHERLIEKVSATLINIDEDMPTTSGLGFNII
jgi:hypothetical protein